MKIIFFGTPQISVPYLERLCEKGDVVGVVTRPDKPAQRGQKLQKSPVKILAEEKKINFFQPTNLKDEKFLSGITALNPDAGIVVAYGRILPKEVIRLFPKGVFNIHFSLLPDLRGAAPIQRAILRGNEKTGVTSFRIEETLDTGNFIFQNSVDIAKDDDAITLEEKLVPLGISVLGETLKRIESGDVSGTPQTGDSTQAPLIKKEDMKIDWNKSAEEISRQVRAFVRWGAFCKTKEGKMLKIFKSEPINPSSSTYHSLSEKEREVKPGTVCGIEKGRGFLVKCKTGVLLVNQTQLEGKNATDGWSFLQGYRLSAGDRFF